MKANKKRHIAVEPLEERRLFITYQVTGTSGPDTISISISGNDIISVVNGVSDSGSDLINNNIEISALGGDDIISITETGENTVVVLAGGGNDTINIGNGANNLGVIDDAVTINGDSGDDETIFHDSANANATTYLSSLGNRLSTNNMPEATINTEHVRVNAGAGESGMTFNDAPFPDWLFNGGGDGNLVIANGAAGESVLYRTGGTSSGSGALDFPSSTVEFFSTDDLFVNGFSSMTMRTSFQEDVFTVNSSLNSSIVSGTSGGAAPPTILHVNDDIPTCTLDFGTNDGVLDDDSLTFTGDSDGNTLFRVDMGGGTNSINVQGDHHIDTRVGLAGGQQNAIVINNAEAVFHGLQTPKSLALQNSGFARFVGSGTVLSVPTLTVPNGAGTLRIDSGQNGSVVTAFSIAAGGEFYKTGAGTFNVNAPQSHGASLFTSKGGTTNFSTDCGTVASRPLNVFGDNGIINLNATQHVNSVSVNFGDINVGANGNRVVVTNHASVSGESGSINLNDNDMIVDYTNPADAPVVRAILHTGRANGAWNGLGIQSDIAANNPLHNTTLGSMEATEFKSVYGAGATFDGQSLDNTAVIIKYTYYGDADFNGFVNFDDYSRLDAGFNGNKSGWLNGDFDDDGDVNFDDYSLSDNAFNTQGSALRGGADGKHNGGGGSRGFGANSV